MFYERQLYIEKIKENEFNLMSKIINIENINTIETFIELNYANLLSLQSKLQHFLEIFDDFKTNLNFSLDKLYLEDNFLCDENKLHENIITTTNLMNDFYKRNEKKIEILIKVKEKMNHLYNLYIEEKQIIEEISKKLNKNKSNKLDSEIVHILHLLKKENELFENAFN